MSLDPGACRSCGGRILWATTAAGKKIPLDPEPANDGTFVIEGGRAVARVKDAAGPRYLSHFVTCPKAATHRKPRARKGAGTPGLFGDGPQGVPD